MDEDAHGLGVDTPPSSLMDSTANPKVKLRKEKELKRVPWLVTLRGRRACWNSRMGLGRLTSNSLTHMDLHKPNNKLISV